MPVELINPDGLPKPDVYAQVGIASGSRTVYLSGQVARTAEGDPVGAGDLAAQAAQALRNVHTALTGAGATFDDIAKVTIYVVDLDEAKLGLLVEGLLRAVGELGVDPVRPTTVLGVASLAEADLLVEIEAIAVLP
jgi:enamine deaminase RidA (YjgF/YER057c/UK114 family)